jgi:hypothetical protein
LKTLEGSKIVRGRKNRRNMKKFVARKPVTLTHTMRRRSLFTGGSGALSTNGPPAGGLAATGFGGALATAAVGVVPACAAPGATRAAGVVADGTSFAGGASALVPAGKVSFGSLSTPQTSSFEL